MGRSTATTISDNMHHLVKFAALGAAGTLGYQFLKSSSPLVANVAKQTLRTVSTPLATGFVSAAGTLAMYSASSTIAEKGYPLKSESCESAARNRMIVLGSTTFLLTAMLVNPLKRLITDHQHSKLGLLAVSTAATATSFLGLHFSERRAEKYDAWAAEETSFEEGLEPAKAVGVTTAVILGAIALSALAFKNITYKAAPSMMVVVPIMTFGSYQLRHEPDRGKRAGILISSIAVSILAGSLLAPTLSSMMLKNRVGYLEAGLHSAGGVLACILGNALIRKRRESRDERVYLKRHSRC